MVAAGPLRSNKSAPIPIDARAADHLKYIRETMESAAEFTAVPGWGGVAMGITALAAAFFAARQSSPRAWLTGVERCRRPCSHSCDIPPRGARCAKVHHVDTIVSERTEMSVQCAGVLPS